ncbi:MAG: RNA polymerase sigma-70 factor [Bacteroidales bacterium]|nr:RNA polymerase sigma-70 factor [Bacteroidales bacterium]
MQTFKVKTDITSLTAELRKGNRDAFHHLYDAHYNKLCNFCYKVLNDKTTAEEVVQNFMLKLWEKREALHLPDEIDKYLYKAVYNNSIEYLRKKSKVSVTDNFDINHERLSHSENMIETVELSSRISSIKKSLPEMTLQIFEMNRNEGLSYPQIAEQLQISVKTVEYHISKALKTFRQNLSEYLAMALLFIYLINNKPF